MQKAIDVSSMNIQLYSDKSVKEFTELVSQPDSRMWLSNASAETAATAAALAVKALRKSGVEDAGMKEAEHFIEVLRKFFLKTIDQELQSRAEWDNEVEQHERRAYIEGAVFAACSEIDEILYGMIKLIDMLNGVSDKLTPSACADAAAAVNLGRSAMEGVKLQRYYYSTLISGDVNVLAMRREPELAIEESAARFDALYKKLQDKIK